MLRRHLVFLSIVTALAAVPVAGLLDRGAGAAAQQDKLPPELRKITAGDVTAHFGGVRTQDDESFPLEYSVTQLWFSFKGDRRRYPFRPQGELFFSDWTFDIFSPDGKFVLLLADRFGPFHVVDVAKLKDYLRGRAKPDFVLYGWGTGAPRSNAAGVHHGARWVSPDTFQFKFSCCGETRTQTGFVKDFPIPDGFPFR